MLPLGFGRQLPLRDLEAAENRASTAAALGASDDALTQTLARQVRANVLAARGHHAAAERVAREAIAIASATDLLNVQADAHYDLADVLALGGRTDQAGTALGEALRCFQRKGNIVMAEQTRLGLAEDAIGMG